MYTDESVHMGRASEASRNVSVVFVGGGGGGGDATLFVTLDWLLAMHHSYRGWTPFSI